MAAFDLDGTLTRRDTLLPFLLQVAGVTSTARALVLEAPTLILTALGRRSRHEAKERLLVRLLHGRDVVQLEPAAELFAAHAERHLLREWARDRIAWHRTQGHEVIIVTASPELYVSALGRRLGVDAVLGTRLAVDADGRLTGRLLGANCRGPEKVVRLQDWLGVRRTLLIAYGDSPGDRELLAVADIAINVGRQAPPQPELAGA